MMQMGSPHSGASFEMLARYWWAKATLPISAIAKLEYARLPRIRMMAALKRSGAKAEGDEAAASPASGGRSYGAKVAEKERSFFQ
jgi:hypothetical protein